MAISAPAFTFSILTSSRLRKAAANQSCRNGSGGLVPEATPGNNVLAATETSCSTTLSFTPCATRASRWVCQSLGSSDPSRRRKPGGNCSTLANHSLASSFQTWRRGASSRESLGKRPLRSGNWANKLASTSSKNQLRSTCRALNRLSSC